MIVAVIRTSNSVEIYDEAKFGLDFLKGVVGGWIEPVHLPNAGTMYVNEEGILHALPLNRIASVMYALNGGDSPILGDAVMCGPTDEKGDETDLSMPGFELISKSVSLAMIQADQEERKN